jgi:hypothetical protein
VSSFIGSIAFSSMSSIQQLANEHEYLPGTVQHLH